MTLDLIDRKESVYVKLKINTTTHGSHINPKMKDEIVKIQWVKTNGWHFTLPGAEWSYRVSKECIKEIFTKEDNPEYYL